MAPAARSGGNSTFNSLEPTTATTTTNGNVEERNIWSSILQQVQKTATNKLPSNKSILVLGDNDSGKSSLIAKMQGCDTACKGSGLEYHHLNVRDEYRDEQTQCGVWIVDGNYQWKANLLKFALNEENFADTTVLLVCSMNKPWDVLSSLQHWTDVLEAHIKTLKIEPKEMEAFRERSRRRFQDYISPGDEIEGMAIRNRALSSGTNLEDSAPKAQLPENVLVDNLGLDIVVAVTKTDYMSTLEKEFDYREEHFDFIQQAVRKLCLRCGASLVYVSAKISKNCDLLYKYLVHRIYGLKFKTPALVVEKDAVFIPSGWDNDKKIAILYENIQSFSPDDDYNEIIKVPSNVNLTTKETENIAAEDDQIFLVKLRTQLNQQAPSNSTTPLRANTSTSNSSMTATPAAKSSGRASVTGTPTSTAAAMLDNSKNSPGGEGVLQTFFNSLLNRKSVGGSGGVAGSPGGTPSTPGGRTLNLGGSTESLRNRDVQAELNRLSGAMSNETSNQVDDDGVND